MNDYAPLLRQQLAAALSRFPLFGPTAAPTPPDTPPTPTALTTPAAAPSSGWQDPWGNTLRVPTTRADFATGAANFLGGPVDTAAWFMHKMGVPIQGSRMFYSNGNRAPWEPDASVPFSSQYIKGVLADPGVTGADVQRSLTAPRVRLPPGLF